MLQEIENLSNKLHHLVTDNWISNDLFTFQWWVILIVNALFFALLLFLMDRKRILQISLAFMICYFIVNILDDIGVYYGWWSYPHQLVPFTSEFDAVDFAIVPAALTLIYQLFHTWKNYVLMGVGTALIFAFVGLPIFVYMGAIKLNNWSYINSFLVLILLSLLLKSIMDFITRRDHYLKQLKQDGRQYRFSLFQTKKKAR